MAELFAGSWALVTGASSGLGEQMARQLAARRANLILTARSEHKLGALAQELARGGVETRVVAADLAEPGAAVALARSVDALGLPVAHLINNAGFGHAGALLSADVEQQSRMVRLNCEALMTLSRLFAPAMVARGAGGIVHVASTAAFQALPFMATYAATKAFVLSFSVALAEELRGTGVRVLALCPGPVPTGFQAAAGIRPGMERVAALSAADTVRRGLEAYEAGENVCIPGAVNRVQTLVSKLAPRALVTGTVARAMKRMGRAK